MSGVGLRLCTSNKLPLLLVCRTHRISRQQGQGYQWEMAGAVEGNPCRTVRREQLCGLLAGVGRAVEAVQHLTGTPGWERRRRKKGGERQQFHEGPDLGRRRRQPSSPEPRLPLSPTGTSVNGSGQELSTGRPLPWLLAGDSGGDGLPLRSASLDTRDAFSFLRTPQL